MSPEPEEASATNPVPKGKAIHLAYLALCQWLPPRMSENGIKRHEALKEIEKETCLVGNVAHYNAAYRPERLHTGHNIKKD